MLFQLEDQNQKLREQNRRCTDQLKALTSFAERNKQSRQSLLFSQSVTVSFNLNYKFGEHCGSKILLPSLDWKVIKILLKALHQHLY